MLTNVLNIRRLSQKLVNLIAHVELLMCLKVPSSQLLPDSSENLQSAGILSFTGFIRNALLRIKNATFEDGWPAMAGEIARLHAVFKVDILNDRLSTFRREGCSIGGLAHS